MPRSTYPATTTASSRTATRSSSTPSPSPPGRRCLPEARVPAVFLDRDGVINRRRRDHVKAWDEFEFLPACSVRWRPSRDGYTRGRGHQPGRGGSRSSRRRRACSIHTTCCRRSAPPVGTSRRSTPASTRRSRTAPAASRAPTLLQRASVDLGIRLPAYDHGGRQPERRRGGARRRMPSGADQRRRVAADPDILAVKDLPEAVTLWRDLSMVGARPC